MREIWSRKRRRQKTFGIRRGEEREREKQSQLHGILNRKASKTKPSIRVARIILCVPKENDARIAFPIKVRLWAGRCKAVEREVTIVEKSLQLASVGL